MEMISYIHESHSVINLRNLSNLVVMKEAALKPPPVKDSFDRNRSGYRNISVMTQMNMTPVTSEFDMKRGGGVAWQSLGLILPRWCKAKSFMESYSNF